MPLLCLPTDTVLVESGEQLDKLRRKLELLIVVMNLSWIRNNWILFVHRILYSRLLFIEAGETLPTTAALLPDVFYSLYSPYFVAK